MGKDQQHKHANTGSARRAMRQARAKRPGLLSRASPAFVTRHKRLIWLSVILIIATCAYYVLQQQMGHFSITTVKIQGKITRTSEQEIWDSIANLLNKGFFGTDVSAIKTNLQKLPWVAQANIKKVWPDKIAVTVTEKIPLASWRGKGIVTTDGDIIAGDKFNEASNLPVFWGTDKQVKEMLDNYLSMTDILSQHELTIKQIEIMPDQGVRAILNNGIMLFLGQEGLLDRVNRFTLAYRNKLHKIAYTIDYVDLRYVNGLAVGWKSNTKQPKAQ